jgi:hypothetical protein
MDKDNFRKKKKEMKKKSCEENIVAIHSNL